MSQVNSVLGGKTAAFLVCFRGTSGPEAFGASGQVSLPDREVLLTCAKRAKHTVELGLSGGHHRAWANTFEEDEAFGGASNGSEHIMVGSWYFGG